MSQGGSNYKKTISGVSLYHAYVRGKKKYLHVVHENRTLKCKIRSTHTRSLTDTRSPVCVCVRVSLYYSIILGKKANGLAQSVPRIKENTRLGKPSSLLSSDFTLQGFSNLLA